MNKFNLAIEQSKLALPLGNETEFEAIQLATNRRDDHQNIMIPRVTIPSKGSYEAALRQTVKHLQVITDPETYQNFEITYSGVDSLEDGPFDTEFSTYNSAISSNPGNAVEFAEHAALRAEKPRLYIASAGNGFSSYLSAEEQRYVKTRGRFTYDDFDGDRPITKAIPTIRALKRALESKGVVTDRLSSNSSGANMLTALMYELPEGTVTHAYMKGRPNLVDQSAIALGYRMLVLETRANNKNKERSKDEWALIDEMVDEAKTKLKPVIDSIDAERLGKLAMVAKLRTDCVAYSRGPDPRRKGRLPAAYDSVRALHRQPDAKVTWHFTSRDRLYTVEPHRPEQFIRYVSALSRDSNNVTGLVTNGSHADHTHIPSLRWSAEEFAFEQ